MIALTLIIAILLVALVLNLVYFEREGLFDIETVKYDSIVPSSFYNLNNPWGKSDVYDNSVCKVYQFTKAMNYSSIYYPPSDICVYEDLCFEATFQTCYDTDQLPIQLYSRTCLKENCTGIDSNSYQINQTEIFPKVCNIPPCEGEIGLLSFFDGTYLDYNTVFSIKNIKDTDNYKTGFFRIIRYDWLTGKITENGQKVLLIHRETNKYLYYSNSLSLTDDPNSAYFFFVPSQTLTSGFVPYTIQRCKVKPDVIVGDMINYTCPAAPIAPPQFVFVCVKSGKVATTPPTFNVTKENIIYTDGTAAWKSIDQTKRNATTTIANIISATDYTDPNVTFSKCSSQLVPFDFSRPILDIFEYLKNTNLSSLSFSQIGYNSTAKPNTYLPTLNKFIYYSEIDKGTTKYTNTNNTIFISIQDIKKYKK